MRPQCIRNPLDVLLRECYARPHSSCNDQRRTYITGSSQPAGNPKDIAVLGGGITGLSTAYFLSLNPSCKVTLFEAGPRLGGWLHSTSVDVGTGKVLFEQGPRTLRPSFPNGMVTLHLMKLLGMEKEVLMTSKNSVAAQNRFIYYPDHLVRMPGPGASLLENLSTLWKEPIFQGVIQDILSEPFKPKASEDLVDESVSSFISRRFGTRVVDNILSAVLHGIYAGDVDKLSAKSILPKLWLYERTTGSVIDHALDAWWKNTQTVSVNDVDLMNHLRTFMVDKTGALSGMFRDIRSSSVFTFKKGIGRLAERLEEQLMKKPNVTIRKNTPVHSLELVTKDTEPQISLTFDPPKTNPVVPKQEFSHAISTISSKALYQITEPHGCLEPLTITPSVTVMVVNIYYSNPDLLPVHGFGYLLPRSLPLDQNPERALGVVFDSDATIGQDEIPGTKLTVMLGGHWWDGWDAYPDEEEGAFMAKSVLARHLQIEVEPTAIRVSLQKDCIPQYTVGHSARLGKLHHILWNQFGQGRLRVAGSSYSGVGLNDCVRSAYDIYLTSAGAQGPRTGLEVFAHGEQLVTLKDGKKLVW